MRVLLRMLEGDCEQALEQEGFNLSVVRFWKRELKALLDEESGGTLKESFSYGELFAAVCDHCRSLAPKLQEEYARQRSTVWEEALDGLLSEYGKRAAEEGPSNCVEQEENTYSHRSYEAISKLVEARCQLILEPNGDMDSNAILHQLSSRTKTLKSLREKAQKVADSLAKSIVYDPYRSLAKELPQQDAKSLLIENIKDLAGIRILVYFPHDVPKVVEAIQKDPILQIEQGTIIFTKSRADKRQQDKDALQEAHDRSGGDFLSMLNISPMVRFILSPRH